MSRTGRVGQAENVLERVAGPWRHAFDLAWESWAAGSLGIGAVLVDASGQVVAGGRNRVLEEPGSGPIAGALVAHAEMNAFATLGLRTAQGMTLYTTVEPCLMCAAASVAMRLSHVEYAAADPVFEGLPDVLGAHTYTENRMPSRRPIGEPLLAAVGAVLPLAHRVWARSAVEPRPEWLGSNRPHWLAAQELVTSGVLPDLAGRAAGLDEVIETVRPALERHGAV